MVQQNTLKRTGLSILTCMTHSFGKEEKGWRVWERKRDSECLDRWTDIQDRQDREQVLSIKVFSVHSYEKEYSGCSLSFYLLLVFTLVSFLVNFVHECRSTQWVGKGSPLILTSSPIPDCILIPPELLNQCKTNTNCQGCSSLLEKQGFTCPWLIRLSAVYREAYGDSCYTWLYDIFRNLSICLSFKSWADERKCRRPTYSFASPLKVYQMFNLIRETITDSDNSRFQRRLSISLYRRWWSVLSSLSSPLYLKVLNAIYHSTSPSLSISKGFLEIESACGVDHRSQ